MSTEVNQTVSKVKGAIEDESITEQESGFRYAAYANRLRTILLASHRYVAYTSDIGESFPSGCSSIFSEVGIRSVMALYFG